MERQELIKKRNCSLWVSAMQGALASSASDMTEVAAAERAVAIADHVLTIYWADMNEVTPK